MTFEREEQLEKLRIAGRVVAALDREARKRGVTRQSLIKLWLADKLEATAK